MGEPRVSVVFVTYNRPHTLVAAFESFVHGVDYPRDHLELILADDASDRVARHVINVLPFDVRCYARRNGGLGANANRGVRAASGDYVLFLQDDWMFVRRPSFLREAVAVLERWPDIGLVLLRDFGDAADERREGAKLIAPGEGRVVYSDNPHLKRRDYHEVVGWYREGTPMTITERDMVRAVEGQTRYRTAVLEGADPFVHIGERWSFNPGQRRARLEQLIRRLPLGGRVLDLRRRARHGGEKPRS